MSTDCVVPDLGENIESATVVEIFVAVGDEIESDQSILSLETDKAEFELPASHGGKVLEVLVAPGDDVVVGQTVLRLEGVSSDAATEKKTPPAEPRTTAEAAAEPTSSDVPPPAPMGHVPSQVPVVTDRNAGPVPASPTVRRLARELGIDVRRVMATGEAGRITADDVHRFVRGQMGAQPARKSGAAIEGPELPDFSKWGDIERRPMSKVRRRTAENMGQAWASIPHVTHHDKADVTDLEARRRAYSQSSSDAGTAKTTMTAVLLAVLGRALAEFPKFNTSVDMRDSSIVYKEYIHVGVAVDTDKGLLVPVVRDVDQKTIAELAEELLDLSERARGRNIRPDALQGASFTLTNLGGIGGVAFTPLINPPEVAVLGVSRGVQEPLWQSDRFEPRLMLPLSLSYDHRVIDGADAARFVRWICNALEDPSLLGGG
jgi:pyruvate dehydrogenase E2 component (dihydrolipoamide acetyltransferase)